MLVHRFYILILQYIVTKLVLSFLFFFSNGSGEALNADCRRSTTTVNCTQKMLFYVEGKSSLV